MCDYHHQPHHHWPHHPEHQLIYWRQLRTLFVQLNHLPRISASQSTTSSRSKPMPSSNNNNNSRQLLTNHLNQNQNPLQRWMLRFQLTWARPPMRLPKLTQIVLQVWWGVLMVSCGLPGSSAPDTLTDPAVDPEPGRSRGQLNLEQRSWSQAHPPETVMMTRDQEPPSPRTNSRGWDKSSLPTDIWPRRGGGTCVLSLVWVRINWRSGSRTREPSWRRVRGRRGNWPRCWSLRDSTIIRLWP